LAGGSAEGAGAVAASAAAGCGVAWSGSPAGAGAGTPDTGWGAVAELPETVVGRQCWPLAGGSAEGAGAVAASAAAGCGVAPGASLAEAGAGTPDTGWGAMAELPETVVGRQCWPLAGGSAEGAGAEAASSAAGCGVAWSGSLDGAGVGTPSTWVGAVAARAGTAVGWHCGGAAARSAEGASAEAASAAPEEAAAATVGGAASTGASRPVSALACRHTRAGWAARVRPPLAALAGAGKKYRVSAAPSAGPEADRFRAHGRGAPLGTGVAGLEAGRVSGWAASCSTEAPAAVAVICGGVAVDREVGAVPASLAGRGKDLPATLPEAGNATPAPAAVTGACGMPLAGTTRAPGLAAEAPPRPRDCRALAAAAAGRGPSCCGGTDQGSLGAAASPTAAAGSVASARNAP